MHFAKTYSQLLLTLPKELQDNAIEYRQLKKLINKVVLELTSLGLSPSVLHGLLQPQDSESTGADKGKQRAPGERPDESSEDEVPEEATTAHGQPGLSNGKSSPISQPKAVYELVQEGERLEPRLRLWVGTTSGPVDSEEITETRCGDEISDSRVAIFLDKPESTPSSPIIEKSQEDALEPPEEDLLLVSKPITARPGRSLVWSLQKQPTDEEHGEGSDEQDTWKTLGQGDESSESLATVTHPVELVRNQMQLTADGTRELIIPLASDTAFYQLLYTALQSLASHLLVVRANFIASLENLARTVSRTARPKSATSRFHPASSSSDPQSITTPLISPFSSSFIPGGKTKSDLYAWREILQLYVESEVFESMSERDRGERDIMDSELRLAQFAERVTGRGLSDSRKLRLKDSRDALEKFLELNVLILNLKKFQFATAEAARKILKKHAKRTALPLPRPRLDVDGPTSFLSESQLMPLFNIQGSTISHSDILAIIPTTAISLPHMLVQAIGETVLPVIPHIDDYACLICGDIAFKPIRLGCGHLFCVRCLVKMQKRGQDHCPCCRAPTVLKADRSNVDWALLNFMQDWFPQESSVKLRQNEKEAAQEELEELGLSDKNCVIM